MQACMYPKCSLKLNVKILLLNSSFVFKLGLISWIKRASRVIKYLSPLEVMYIGPGA